MSASNLPGGKPESLSGLIENNLYEFLEFTANQSEIVEMESFHNLRHVSSRNSLWPNFIYRCYGAELDQNALKEFANQISNKTSSLCWLQGEEFREVNGQVLKSSGYLPITRWQLLALHKQQFRNGNWVERKEIAIKKVVSKSQLEEWVSIAGSSFGKLNTAVFEKMLGNEQVFFLTATYHNKAVSCMMMWIKNQVAGFYHLATLNDYKDKGIATYMTDHALRMAFDHDCNLVVLQVSKKGYPIVKKLGFMEYGAIDLYLIR